jgi:uncharacterized membrane protein
LLILYLAYRQITAAIGLHSTAGHPQTVRPLVAPMALAAAERQHGHLDEATEEKVKAYSAATDNVGLFFGEDIFFAIGSIVLIQQVLATYGYILAPLELALWAIPSANAAFILHGARLVWFDRRLTRPSLSRSDGEGDRSKSGGGVIRTAANPSTIPSAGNGPPPHEASPRREERE